MSFTSLMNTRRFSPTLAQLQQLEASTKAVIGQHRISAFVLSEVKFSAGLAIFQKNGYKYTAARLLANGRWYLTGELAFGN